MGKTATHAMIRTINFGRKARKRIRLKVARKDDRAADKMVRGRGRDMDTVKDQINEVQYSTMHNIKDGGKARKEGWEAGRRAGHRI